MFKVKIGCTANILKEIFEIDDGNYNFRYDFLIKQHNTQLVYYGIETASFMGRNIWDTLPNNYKEANSLKSF